MKILQFQFYTEHFTAAWVTRITYGHKYSIISKCNQSANKKNQLFPSFRFLISHKFWLVKRDFDGNHCFQFTALNIAAHTFSSEWICIQWGFQLKFTIQMKLNEWKHLTFSPNVYIRWLCKWQMAKCCKKKKKKKAKYNRINLKIHIIQHDWCMEYGYCEMWDLHLLGCKASQAVSPFTRVEWYCP